MTGRSDAPPGKGMQPLSAALRVSILTLCLFQAGVLLLRLPGSRASPAALADALGLLALVLLIGLRAALAPVPPARQAAGYLLLWAGGSVLGRMADQGRRWLWHLSAAGLGSILLLLGAVGFADALPFRLFTAFALLLAVLYPLRLLGKLWAGTRAPVFLWLLAPAALWVPAGACDAWLARAGRPALDGTLYLSLLLLAGTGYLLAGENRLQSPAWTGVARRLSLQERRIRGIQSRLVQTENTLLLQDRLAASGLLTAGAAHEFKNILGSIAAAAEYGLARREEGRAAGEAEPAALRRSLAAVARQAAIGRKAVMEVLDKLLRHGSPAAEPIRLAEDLDGLLRLVRASYRPEGIRIESEIPPGLAVLSRRGELEQVLLNLIRNAAESLQRNPRAQERRIRLRAGRLEDAAWLEVLDNGPGVAPHLAERIFEESFSAGGSSGLGLYLARMLVERGGGRLECIPAPEGGCFRLILPLP